MTVKKTQRKHRKIQKKDSKKEKKLQFSLIAVALLLSLILRFSLTGIEGYSSDLKYQNLWGCRALDEGISGAYDDSLIDAPPIYIHVLRINCLLHRMDMFSGRFDQLFISKFTPTMFDIASCIVIFLALKKKGFRTAYTAMLLYAFNPGTIFNLSWWGQIDSVYTFFMLLSVFFIVRKRPELSFIFYAVSVLTKLQGIVIGPVLLFVGLRDHGLRRVFRSGLVALLVVFMILLPNIATGSGLAVVKKAYIGAVDEYQQTTLNAYNIWWLASSNEGRASFVNAPVDSEYLLPFLQYRFIGLLLLASAVVLVFFYLHKRRDDFSVYFASFFLVFSSYFLATRVHERYMFPAFVLLAVSLYKKRALLAVYIVLALSYLANLAIVLTSVYRKTAPNQFLHKTLAAVPQLSVILAVINTLVFFYLVYLILSEITKRYNRKLDRAAYLFVIIFIITIFTRLYALDLRPVHHDEAVFTHFIFQIMRGTPFDYWYDAHGPILFYVTAAIFKLGGISAFNLRVGQAVLSILTVLLLVPLRKKLGKAGFMTAAAFLAVSPTIIYFSRYAFHESYFAFVSLACVATLFIYLRTKNANYLYATVALHTLLFFIKEVAYMFTFVTCSFFGMILLIRIWKLIAQEKRFKKVMSRIFSPISSTKEAVSIWLKISIPVIIVLAITITLASSFFFRLPQAPGVIWDNFTHNFEKTTDTGHNKPWTYFLGLFSEIEPAILVFITISILIPLIVSILILANRLILKRKNSALKSFARLFLPHSLFHGYVLYWSIFMLMISAYIPYKTPWNIVYQSLPLILLGGIVVQKIYKALPKSSYRIGLIVILSLLWAQTAYSSWNINYVDYVDEEKNPLVYVHTTHEVEVLAEYIRARAQEYEAHSILIIADEYWPLPFYCRDLNAAYPSKDDATAKDLAEYDIIVCDPEQLPDEMPDNHIRKDFEMRPGVEISVVSMR
jgi:uncharacterized protein (TIGR03663 family)